MKAQPAGIPRIPQVPPCPDWCHPQFCQPAPRDVIHRSYPVTVDTDDAVITLGLLKADERVHPESWGNPPTVQLTVESTSCATERGGDQPLTVATDLTPAEAARVVDALTFQLLQVRMSHGGGR